MMMMKNSLAAHHVLFSVKCLWTHTGPKHSPQTLCLRTTERWRGLERTSCIRITQRDLTSSTRCCVERVWLCHCYWEVERKGHAVIGVTYRGITRREVGLDSELGGNNKSWSLNCSDGHYSARYNGRVTYIRLPTPHSNRVGVYLDQPAGTLSFYKVSPDGRGSSDTLTHLPFHLHPGGSPPCVWVLVHFSFLSVSV